jgi:hypothetical protein
MAQLSLIDTRQSIVDMSICCQSFTTAVVVVVVLSGGETHLKKNEYSIESKQRKYFHATRLANDERKIRDH